MKKPAKSSKAGGKGGGGQKPAPAFSSPPLPPAPPAPAPAPAQPVQANPPTATTLQVVNGGAKHGHGVQTPPAGTATTHAPAGTAAAPAANAPVAGASTGPAAASATITVTAAGGQPAVSSSAPAPAAAAQVQARKPRGRRAPKPAAAANAPQPATQAAPANTAPATGTATPKTWQESTTAWARRNWGNILKGVGIAVIVSILLLLYNKLSGDVRKGASNSSKVAVTDKKAATSSKGNKSSGYWSQADGLPRANTVNVYNYGHVVNGGRDSVIRVNFADQTTPKGFKQEVTRTIDLFQGKAPTDCCEGKISFEVPPHNKYRFKVPDGYHVPLDVSIVPPGLKVLVGGRDINTVSGDSIRATKGVFEVGNDGDHPVTIVIPYRKTPPTQ